MNIQCRTCHAIAPDHLALTLETSGDITTFFASIERALFFGGEHIVYPVPCGHGQYRGIRPVPPQAILFAAVAGTPEADTTPWQWEWWDAEALAQEQAQREYGRTQPAVEAWDPPALHLLCACGQPITAQGVLEEDDEYGAFEGWEGTCAECGIVVQVKDGGLMEKTYRQLREARHQEAIALWEALRPPAPNPLVVARLLEAESED